MYDHDANSLWYLRSCSMFDLCSEGELEQIGNMARLHTAIRSAEITLDDVGSQVYFIKSGHMKLIRVLPDGTEVLVDLLGPGEFFGRIEGMPTLRPMAGSEEYAVAVDEVLVCLFDRQTFELILATIPSLQRNLLTHVADRVEYVSTRLVDMAFRTASERLENLLGMLAQRYGIRKGRVTRIPVRLSHSEIGMLTGLSRQTVARLVGELRRDGRLEITAADIIVTDPT